MAKEYPIPLVGVDTGYERLSFLTQDQFFGNTVFQVTRNDVTSKQSTKCIKRPGIQNYMSNAYATSAATRGVYYWSVTNLVYFILGNTLYSTTGSAETNRGTVSTSNSTNGGFQFEEFFDGTNYYLLLKDDGGNLYYLKDDHTLAQVSDTDYTSLNAVGPVVVMDGFVFCINANSQINNSDVNSITSWNPISYLRADQFMDGGIGIAKVKNFIIAFGKGSMEVFTNAGNASGSVLVRHPEYTAKVGCINHRSIKALNDTIFWCGRTYDNQIGVYMLDGLKPKRISTPSITQYLQGALTTSNDTVAGMVITLSTGKPLYIISVGSTQGFSYAYDTELDMWTPWWIYNSQIGGGTVKRPLVNFAGTYGTGEQWGNPSTALFTGGSNTRRTIIQLPYAMNDKLSCLGILNSTTTHDDLAGVAANGNLIEMKVDIGPLNYGTANRKFMERLRVIGDQVASSSITVSVSDDDGATFTNVGTLDLSTTNPQIHRLGSFRNRYIRLLHTSDANCSIRTVIPLIDVASI